MSSRSVPLLACLALGLAAIANPQEQQHQSDEALVAALRAGGHVLLMRHAHSPRQPPAADVASAGNATLQRELDETGRTTAIAMGEALRKLGIRIGTLQSSPTFRAVQTARLLDLGDPTAVTGLGDRGGAEGAAWLLAAAARPPAAGANTLLITHAPNVMAAFPEQGQGMADGETLVIRPDGAGGSKVVGRIPIERWPALSR